MTDATPTLILACGALAREIGMTIRAQALAVAAFCAVIIPAQAETASDLDRGYDYLALCVFAETVTGYVLPALDSRLLRDRRVRKVPGHPSGQTYAIEPFTFTGDGVVGTILRESQFDPTLTNLRIESLRVEARRIPAQLRSRDYLLGKLGVARSPPKPSSNFKAYCEQWTVSLQFTGNALEWAEFGQYPPP